MKGCCCEILTNLHSPFLHCCHITVVTGSSPHLATGYKASLLQGTAITAQPEDVNLGHKSERSGRIFEDSLHYYCCCNKLPQTCWLRTKQIYYLTILGVRVQNGLAELHFIWSLQGRIFPCHFKCLEAALSLGSWCLLLSSKPAAE